MYDHDILRAAYDAYVRSAADAAYDAADAYAAAAAAAYDAYVRSAAR